MLKKNVEIEIPANDPFLNDRLGRKQIAENLTLLVQSTNQPFVLSVQAPWGWGKTTFIKMWKAQLESLGHVCFYFNAWENDFVEDPLIAFVGVINKSIVDKSPKGQINAQIRALQNVGGKIIRRALPLTVQIATQGILGQDSVKRVSDLLFNNGGDIASFASELAEEKMRQYENDKNGTQEFKNELTRFTKSISAGRKSPVVFFIDELDLCRPNFSIALLERIKHLLSVEGMVFVLSMDRAQIEQTIKSTYGKEIDSNGYLRKFIDLGINLPEPTAEKYCQFLFERFRLQEVFANRRNGKDEREALMRAFINLGKTYRFSLRVLEQCFTEINLVLRTTPPSTRLFPHLLALFVALKAARPNSYSILLGELFYADIKKLLDEVKCDLDLSDRVNLLMMAQFEVYLVFGRLETVDLRAEPLAVLRTSAGSENPVERRYSQQVIRFAEQIQSDSYLQEVKNLILQISLIEKLTVTE